MRYVLLIYANETAGSQASKQEQDALMAAYMAFGEEFKDKILGGDALLSTSSATTVRVRAGKTLTTDGPFAETKEQLGGYYVVNCKDLDEAIQIAARIPDAANGSIEVRPIMEFN
ncbi:MAG: YciI family protein [Ktedonobacterales bacterium]